MLKSFFSPCISIASCYLQRNECRMDREYNLEKRLIDYACATIDLVAKLPRTRAGSYIGGQLIRSGNSPAFNYGEVQAAESRSDFIHKMRVVLKELKECRVALSIIAIKGMIESTELLNAQRKETEELISIIGKSIQTAEKNRGKEWKARGEAEQGSGGDS